MFFAFLRYGTTSYVPKSGVLDRMKKPLIKQRLPAIMSNYPYLNVISFLIFLYCVTSI